MLLRVAHLPVRLDDHVRDCAACVFFFHQGERVVRLCNTGFRIAMEMPWLLREAVRE